MSQIFTAQFSFNKRSLQLLGVGLHSQPVPDWLSDEVKRAFEALAPFFKNENQVLYIRDIPYLNVDGKFPLGHCYNEYEAMISVPSWDTDMAFVTASINHELHHMARWQNPGYGRTLGGAIVSEGIATYYEKRTSGWSPPWSIANVPVEAMTAVLKGWDDKNYDHNAWFFEGPYGKWVGYGIGYKLAQKLFANGFDLALSVRIKDQDAYKLLRG